MSLKDLVLEIYKAGLTQQEIARFAGVDPAKISRLSNYGGDAKYSVGKRIEELYVVVCIRERSLKSVA